MPDIKHLVRINASTETVYKAVTEQAGIAGWWTKETIAKPKIGSYATFKFGDRYFNLMKIVELLMNRKVVWECLQGDKEWVGTTFVFDINGNKNETTLRFTHGNWRAQTDFFASCNYQWGHYMNSLKNYCETGVGDPFE